MVQLLAESLVNKEMHRVYHRKIGEDLFFAFLLELLDQSDLIDHKTSFGVQNIKTKLEG